jgi:hypothetical protein
MIPPTKFWATNAIAVLDECDRTLNSSKYTPTLNGLPSPQKKSTEGQRAKGQESKGLRTPGGNAQHPKTVIEVVEVGAEVEARRRTAKPRIAVPRAATYHMVSLVL